MKMKSHFRHFKIIEKHCGTWYKSTDLLPQYGKIGIYIIRDDLNSNDWYFCMQNTKREEIYIPFEELIQFLNEYKRKENEKF